MQAISPYGVLRLKPGCKEEELKAAYKKRVLETHPDKGGSVEEFRAVQTAYEALQKSLPVPESQSSSSSRASRPPDVFTPFNVPHFPPAFRPPKRRKTLEERLEAAFAGIPRAPRAPSVRPPAKPLRPAPKRVQAKPKASPVSPLSSPRKASSDDWATKLWAELVQLAADQRAKAITALPASAKARLKAHLQAQKEAREAEAASSSSSSSETSDEAEEGQARSCQAMFIRCWN